MTYSPNIPMSTDNPSASQTLILANFQQLNMQYGTAGDHVPFTASSNNGAHNKVTWLNQSASIPTSNVQQVVAYGKTQSGITMPYYQRDSLITEYPLSPIKAWAYVSLTGVMGNQTLSSNSFNVTSVSLNGGGTLCTVTLTNAMLTTFYGVYIQNRAAGNIGPVTIISTSSFTFPYPGLSVSFVGFTFFCLEP